MPTVSSFVMSQQAIYNVDIVLSFTNLDLSYGLVI